MRFGIALLAGLGMATLVWLVVIYAQLGNPTPSWVHHAYLLKQRAADAIQQPKIVIVSGSSALFGINSTQLSQTYRRPVVNLGVNAAMLLPYILYRSKQVLKPGDIALLPLEYPLYLYNGETNAQLIDQILARDSEFLWQLSWHERVKTLWETPFERVWQGYHPSDIQPPMTSLYGIHNIDPLTGDQLNTSEAQRLGQELLEWRSLRDKVPQRYGNDDKPDNLAWRYLRDYIHWAEQHGICLIFLPSAFLESDRYHTELVEQTFYTSLPGKIGALGAHFIGSPFEYMYGINDMFNTEYHLTDEARQINTTKIINDLGISLDTYCTQRISIDHKSQ